MCTKSFDEWSQIKDSLVVGQIEEIYWGIVPLMIQTWNLVRMSREKYLHTRSHGVGALLIILAVKSKMLLWFLE